MFTYLARLVHAPDFKIDEEFKIILFMSISIREVFANRYLNLANEYTWVCLSGNILHLNHIEIDGSFASEIGKYIPSI